MGGWPKLGEREKLGSGQWDYGEGNSGQWRVAFGEGSLRSEASEVKLWTVDSDIQQLV